MVSVVDMLQPDLDEAKKRNAYGIKEEVLRDMIDKWEPFIHNKLKEKAGAIEEEKDEHEQ